MGRRGDILRKAKQEKFNANPYGYYHLSLRTITDRLESHYRRLVNDAEQSKVSGAVEEVRKEFAFSLFRAERRHNKQFRRSKYAGNGQRVA